MTTDELGAIGVLGGILHRRGGSALRSELLLAATTKGGAGPRLSHKRAAEGLRKGHVLGYFLTGDGDDPRITLVDWYECSS